jgi:hypothetical protein
MSENNEIDNRPCIVVYLDNYLRQVESPDEADLARIIFTDEEGGSMFLFNKYMHLGTVPLFGPNKE